MAHSLTLAYTCFLLCFGSALSLIVPGGDRRPVQELEVAPGGEAEQAFHDAHDGQGGLHRGGEPNATEGQAKGTGNQSG